MQTSEPQSEHLWLHQLVGEWSIESECVMGPDQPPMTTTGREVVRLLGKLWTIGESSGNAPGGGFESIMTLGYDPQTKRFVGSFIASTMTHFWPYSGWLDASGRILTLDSEGPSFSGDGTMAKYQDIIEFITNDHRTLTARVQSPDGSWQQFMTAHYRRE
ncbi:MAG TPA: DUF1579 domain-containing protein [Planctomycetaceae bacterium]|nr:DUF1579 domain-containing protein [Planctomycetaceae bacterium]